MPSQAKKRDYYEVLGVDRGAGEEDLKKAYRRLAIQSHPDRNPGDKQAEERFKELNEAYQVLSDPERRAQYDRYGHAAFQGPQGNGFGFEFTQGFEEVFSDIFGDFFGTGRGRTRSRSRRGDDLRYDLEVEFEEAARGSEKVDQVPAPGDLRRLRWKPCARRRRGRPHLSQLPRHRPGPHPAGLLFHRHHLRPMPRRGHDHRRPMPQVPGPGTHPPPGVALGKDPAGVDNGSRLKLRGEGEAGWGGGPSGDLYVVVHVKEHDLFVRQDNDVVIELPVSFPQAALGTEVEVPTLDGKVKLKIQAGTQSGKVFRLKGKGFPDLHGYGRGDQLVRMVVETPRRLTARQRELLEEFASIDGEAVNHPLSKGFVDKLKEMFG